MAHRFQILALYDACIRECMRCVTAQTCLWLTQSARYGLEDAQRVLLRYTVRNWRLICEEFPESVDVLKEFPEINLQISLGIASLLQA